MMKTRKRFWFYIVTLLSLSLSLCLFVACGKDSPETRDKDADQETGERIEYSLNLEDAKIDLYDSIKLSVVGDYSGNIVWESTNNSVAGVANGLVSAKGEGRTTIKATIGTKVCSCEITVEDSGARPNITCDENGSIGIKKGQKYALNTNAFYKGNKISAEISYTIANSSIAEVSQSGEITAKEYGQTTVTISGSYRGYNFVPINIAVNVVMDAGIDLSEKQVSIFASSPNGEITETTLSAEIYKEGQIVTDKVLQWTTEDESVAVCDNNGRITAVSAGWTRLTVSCDLDGKVCSTTINIQVKRPVVEFDNIDLDLSKTVSGYSFLNFGFDCATVSEVNIVSEDDNNYSIDFTVGQNGINVKTELIEDKLGESTVEILLSKVKYVGTITVATLIISDKNELAQMMNIATEGEETSTRGGYDNVALRAHGYFVLDNDIDFENDYFGLTAYQGGKDGFVGVLDGRGHTVSNVKVKYESEGLFGTVGKKGIIKNIAFVNVGNTTNNAHADFVRRNFLSFVFYGTVENVYLEGTRANITGAFSGAIGQYNKDATVKNLVAVITETASKSSQVCVGTAIGAMQARSTDNSPVENIIGVSSLYPAIKENGNDNSHTSAINVSSYSSVDSASGTYSAADWNDTIWNINGKIPTFKVQSWVIDLTSTGNRGYLELSSTETQSINLDGLEGQVVEIRASNNTVISHNESITLSDESSRVLMSGKPYGETFVIVKTQSQSEYHYYKIKVIGVTKIIKSKADLTAMIDIARDAGSKVTNVNTNYTYYTNADGYYVLANDIDYENGEFSLLRYDSNYSNDGFKGVFDGNGHTISNIAVGDGSYGLFGTIAASGVIKNVAFKNVINTASNDHGEGHNRRNIIAYIFKGTLENVYVEATRGTITGAFSGIIGQYNGGTVKNLVGLLTENANKSNQSCVGTAIGAMLTRSTDSAPVENIVSVSSLYPVIENNNWGPTARYEDGLTNVSGFTSIDAVTATYSIADWDATIWDISGKVPVFKG